MFLIGGVLALVSEWLPAPGPEDPNDLSAAVTALMPAWFTHAQPPSIEVDPD